ncbi:MAG: hypothetical protein N4A46_08590 [Schleiferiaceae bacterium]|jgi:hypothetical protein|nr:hypothetical protein [Schleiferiaceae bacterium]
MKKILAITALIGVLIACKKDDPSNPGGGGVDVKSLHERLHGTWDIVAISYSGAANLPPPFDTSVVRPFTGEAEEIVGYYIFDTVPDPSIMTFDVAFKAPMNFDGGGKITLPVSEGGHATYEVDEAAGMINGVSYVYGNTSTDTTVVPTQWEVIENEPTRQVYATDKNFYFNNDLSKPTLVRMKTTIEKR